MQEERLKTVNTENWQMKQRVAEREKAVKAAKDESEVLKYKVETQTKALREAATEKRAMTKNLEELRSAKAKKEMLEEEVAALGQVRTVVLARDITLHPVPLIWLSDIWSFSFIPNGYFVVKYS